MIGRKKFNRPKNIALPRRMRGRRHFPRTDDLRKSGPAFSNTIYKLNLSRISGPMFNTESCLNSNWNLDLNLNLDFNLNLNLNLDFNSISISISISKLQNPNHNPHNDVVYKID